MKAILHKIAHLVGWNYGRADAFYDGDKLMMSFLCTGCGKRSSIHPCDGIIDEQLKIVPSPRIDYCCECKKYHGYNCPLDKV